ncbi:MAG: hypothetical protein ACREEM_30595 [Blastocatellia bacterium]
MAINLHELLIRIFADLRGTAPALGIGNLRDALRLLDGGWPFESSSALRDDIRLLWCRRWKEEQEFDRLWREHEAALTPTAAEVEKSESQIGEEKPEDDDRESLTPERYTPPATTTPAPKREAPRETFASAVPIKTPAGPAIHAAPAELSAYWPISTRAIEYGWQSLRRPRNDGEATVLDIRATVEAAARRGLLLRPVFSPSARNHLHLVLLVDRRGSMAPFHALSRDFVETAERAEREGVIGRLSVRYFQNVAGDNLYDDPKLARLTRIKDDAPLTLESALGPCGRDTAILILSDAGAARGHRHQGRVAATETMIEHLGRLTPHIAWLNPMPHTRWPGTSARLIALSVPMFEMNRLGFHDSIKTLRGS